MKVKNFSGFMKSRLNESMGEEYDEMNMGAYGANPEDADEDAEFNTEESDEEGTDEEPITLEDLKAMVDELTERIEALEGGGEEEEGEGEEGEGEEGEEGEEDTEANESRKFNKSRRYNRF